MKNIPVIFTEDPKYKKGFSFISTKCSRDLMVHTTETAQRICKKQAGELEEQIQAIKDNHTTVETKTLLEKFDKELVTFKENTINFKSAKFEKDKKIFSVETVYPYLKDDFYTKVESRRVLSDYQGRSKDIFLTFSETSPSDSTGNCDPGEGSSNRNQQRQNSFFKKKDSKKTGCASNNNHGKGEQGASATKHNSIIHCQSV